MITAKQIRKARLLLRITQEQLAADAQVPLTILRNIETGRISLNRIYAATIKVALEGLGVEFKEDNSVRLRPAHIASTPFSWD